jgi:hypothetical protein
MTALYQQLLGPAWSELAPAVQRLHGEQATARGTFCVRRGRTWMARLLGVIMRMPAAAEQVVVTLRVARAGEREHWQRVFGAHPLDSRQWERAGCLVEALGPIQCVFRLHAVEGALGFEQVGAAFGLGRYRVPLPRFLAPRVRGRATFHEGAVRVDVTIAAPGLGLIVGYDGTLEATC